MEKINSSSVRKTSHRDLTKGHILGNLLSLGWPMLISDGLNTFGPTVDMFWVGRLGPSSIAGVGVSGLILNMVNLGIMGINIGLRALIGHYVGRGDTEKAEHLGKQALVLSGFYSILITIILILLAKPILSLFGMEPEVISQGTAYLRLALVGTIPISLHMMCEAVMQAAGDSVTPMKISVLMRVVHFTLDPFFIFGWWIFPNLGVMGAALSSITATTLGMSISLFIVLSGRSRLKITLRQFKIDFSTMWRILKIGLPASISGAQRRFSAIVIMGFITPFGTLAVASYALLERIQQFASICNFGFGRASGVLVAQNLGAKQPERAAKSAWLAMGLGESIMLTLAILMLIWPRQTIGIFTHDADLINFASVLLKIMIVGYSITACEMILSYSLIGAGDTLPPMFFSVIIIWLITVPLTYVLSRFTSLGITGIWWGIAIGMVVSAVTFITYFRLGRWKHKKI